MNSEISVGRRLFKNFGILLGGRTAAAILALGATAVTVKALDPAEFGIVVLVHTYLLVVRGLFNFKPFEAIIKYGVPLQEEADSAKLYQLLRFSLKLDLFSCVFAAIGGYFAVPLVAVWLHWGGQTQSIAALYCLGLLTSGTGTAKGILRLYDRFDALARQLAVGPLVRLLGCIFAWRMELDLIAFLVIWGLSFWVENLVLQVLGWFEYRRRLSARNPSVAESPKFVGIWQFLSVVYWQSNLDLVPKQVSTLLAGGILGNEGAAFFRLARDFSNILAKPALLIRQAAFPDLTRLWHREDPQFLSVVIKTAGYSGAAGLAVVLLSVVIAEPALALMFGPAYAVAAGLMTLLLLAATLDLGAAAFRTSAYAMGRAAQVLWIQVISTAVFVGAFWFLARAIGLNGPGWAACMAAGLGLLGLSLMVIRGRSPAVADREA